MISGDVGKPVLSGNLLIFELAGQIESFDLATGQRTLLRREKGAELRGPSVNGFRLSYIRATYKRQQVLTGLFVPRKVSSDRTLYGTTPTARRDAGHEKGRSPPRATSTSRCGCAHPRASTHPDDDRERRDRDLRDARPPAPRRKATVVSCASTSDRA